jgi:uncharacterized protein YegL
MKTKPKAKAKTPKAKVKATPRTTHIWLVLDRSRSMESLVDVTVEGYNQQLATIKKRKTGRVTIGRTLFNHAIEITPEVPVSKVRPISSTEYNPDGMTAMYDAIGDTIDTIQSSVPDNKETSYLVVILTDGKENASVRWTGSALGTRIDALQRTGRWTFTVQGANIDLSRLRGTLKLDAGNVRLFESSVVGTRSAFSAMSEGTARYLEERSRGIRGVRNFYK